MSSEGSLSPAPSTGLVVDWAAVETAGRDVVAAAELFEEEARALRRACHAQVEQAGGHGVPVALDETWHTWETELKLLAAACRTLGDGVVAAAAGYREAEGSLAGQQPGG